MSDIPALTLRQADQARTDYAAIESDLEVIQKQLARLPTCRELSQDRARDHIRDDDADEAELAVLPAVAGKKSDAASEVGSGWKPDLRELT